MIWVLLMACLLLIAASGDSCSQPNKADPLTTCRSELEECKEEAEEFEAMIQTARWEARFAIQEAKDEADQRIEEELRQRFPGGPKPYSGMMGGFHRVFVFLGAAKILVALVFACGFLIYKSALPVQRVGKSIAMVFGSLLAVWLSRGIDLVGALQGRLLGPTGSIPFDWLLLPIAAALITFAIYEAFYRNFVRNRQSPPAEACCIVFASALAMVFAQVEYFVLWPGEYLGTDVTQHLAGHVFLGVMLGGILHLMRVFHSTEASKW